MNKIIIVLMIILFFIGCVSVKLIIPTQSDVDRIKAIYPDLTIDELNKGKTLFEEKCSHCHNIKNPSSRTKEEWNHIVPEMAEKAKKKDYKISKEEQESILKYLVTMSKGI